MTPSFFKNLVPMIITSVCAGGVLTILAPLGTGRLDFLPRAAYWIGLCAAGGFGAAAIDAITVRAAPGLQRWPRALIQSIGATLIVAGFLFAIWPAQTAAAFALTLFYVWVVSIVISSIGALLEGASRTVNPQQTHARPALYDRLQPNLRQADIYAIASEDHYVRVFTSSGEDMILMRLSDAIKEIIPLEGVQTHRSWWVAEAGVDSITSKNGKRVITLKSGQAVPISRSGMALVKNAGWV